MEAPLTAQERSEDSVNHIILIYLIPSALTLSLSWKSSFLKKQSCTELIYLNCYVKLDHLSFVTMSYFQWLWAR